MEQAGGCEHDLKFLLSCCRPADQKLIKTSLETLPFIAHQARRPNRKGEVLELRGYGRDPYILLDQCRMPCAAALFDIKASQQEDLVPYAGQRISP